VKRFAGGDDARPNEEHVMTAKPKPQAEPFDAARFRKELGLRIQRLVAESLEAWPSCDNVRCRRAKRCASEDRECIRKWSESLPPISPEEAKQRLADFRRDLEKRRAGLPLGEPTKPKQAKERRGNKPASTPATTAQRDNDHEATPPVAHEPQLSPEKAERIDRIWNDYVASLPAEEDKPREPGPRITLL
jgi:5-methylcytosine-specific restriction endonuclease McrA